MAVPPIQYRATDYPPEYRPVGYWGHVRRRTDGPDEAPPARRRRRWWALLAVLFATLVLHAGIAMAYLGDSGSTATSPRAAAKGARCDARGQPDPSVTDPPTQPQDNPDPTQTDPGAGGTGDSTPTGGSNSRGAL